MSSRNLQTPFQLTGTLNSIPSKTISRPMEALLERIFSIKQLDKVYQSLAPSQDEQDFLRQVFESLNINYQVAQEELDRIPKTGPLVVVANHPFGAIEGIIMAAMLRQVRPDVKIMANFILKRIPEIRDLFIAVNPFGGKAATHTNVGPMKEALRWLRQDGLLVVFPAGEVAHKGLGQKQAYDPAWSPSIGRLIQLSQAPVQSVYFSGHNSPLFQTLGMIHPRLRTAMLPRELINKANTTIPIRIGKPMAHNKLRDLGDGQALIDYLRLRTYMLKNAGTGSVASDTDANEVALADTNIVQPVPVCDLINDIDKLPAKQCLVDTGMQVFYAYASQVPNVIREIGRLREVSFRQVGEGTGKALDLDFYDDYYVHLFIWNPDKKEIVGAYRLGEADKILQRQGLVGLYSHSLFKYSHKLLKELNPALELGRSFVRPEYQRSFAPLMLLWKGIGQYVARHPHYRKLFGPVSISSDYQPTSQRLLVDFLKANNSQPHLARMVKPRRKFKAQAIKASQVHKQLTDPDGVSNLIAEIEEDAKGIPILIKQYLKLGGQILEFNVDAQFNNALDGLIMVDLLETEPKILAKYMGKDGVEQFHAFHGKGQQAVA